MKKSPATFPDTVTSHGSRRFNGNDENSLRNTNFYTVTDKFRFFPFTRSDFEMLFQICFFFFLNPQKFSFRISIYENIASMAISYYF